MIRCEQEPYAGGEYHGILEFPSEYPMKPPAIKMLTPSGRFEVGPRLCLTISDYHPESWNPSWSVGAVLVGLNSFFYEESNAIGSLRASTAERRRLAAASSAYNRRNEIFYELFVDDDGTTRAADDAEVEAESESVCRFCYSSEGDLISPCACTDFVHLACLRKWQKSVLLTQSTHPKYQTSIDRICNVCLEEFTGIGAAPSRHEQILQYTGRVHELVRDGNLLVATRESSRENLDLMRKHPEIRDRLAHWTKTVYLMLRSRGGLVAVGTSLPVDPPRHWDGYVASVCADATDRASFRVRHYDGGPVEPRNAVAVLHVPEGGELPKSVTGALHCVGPHMYFGSFEAAAALAIARRRAREDDDDDDKVVGEEKAATTTTINVVWGVASWGETQILAEIARGGWGIVEVNDWIGIRPDRTMDVDWPLDFEWSRIVGLAKCAPKTEYTRRGRR